MPLLPYTTFAAAFANGVSVMVQTEVNAVGATECATLCSLQLNWCDFYLEVGGLCQLGHGLHEGEEGQFQNLGGDVMVKEHGECSEETRTGV